MATETNRAARPSRGELLELQIESLAYGGAGVARRDGYVVFVAGGIPGDTVRAEVGKAKRAYAEARRWRSSFPSPDRLEPVADHPGVPWQVLPLERQLEIKQAQVDDALRRIGRLDGFALEPIVPAVQQWRYRNKLEYSFGAGPGGELVCGFHAPGRWHEIVPLTDCRLASEAGNRAREAVLAWARGARPGAVRPAHRRGLPAQPRRPRGPTQRSDPGPTRHRFRQARPRRARRGAAGRERRPVDADRQRRGDDADRRDRVDRRR